jgi:uracil-DNA glycosylase family 4
LALRDCYIVASVRCAPPQNKPTRAEFARCQPYLERELMLLRKSRVVIVLGAAAMRAFLGAWKATDHEIDSPLPKFRHDGSWSLPPITLLASYHPSQRNTQTGLLTEAMFDQVFRRARRVLGGLPDRQARSPAKATLFKVDGGRETGRSEKA